MTNRDRTSFEIDEPPRLDRNNDGMNDDPAALTLCPTCGRKLGLPEKEWAGEPIPEGVVEMHDVTPLHVSKITVTCANGHHFTARSHTWKLNQGHWYEGLAPE